MPGGVPIASVGVDGAKNAGLLAANIVGAFDDELGARLDTQRETQAAGVVQADARVQEAVSKKD